MSKTVTLLNLIHFFRYWHSRLAEQYHRRYSRLHSLTRTFCHSTSPIRARIIARLWTEISEVEASQFLSTALRLLDVPDARGHQVQMFSLQPMLQPEMHPPQTC